MSTWAARLVIAGASLLMVALGWACTDDDAQCDRLCRKLAACSYLPSSLGGGDDPRENCLDRCQSSTSSFLDSRSKCSAIPDGQCEQLGECLDTNFPGTGARGYGEATISFVLDPVDGNGVDGGPPIRDTFCEQLGTADFSLTSSALSAELAPRSASCELALAEGFTRVRLPAGVHAPVVKIVMPHPSCGGGAADAGASAKVCVLRASGSATLPAGGTARFDVHLPSATCALVAPGASVGTCESDCANGIDDDRDGLTDCEDPVCSAGCGTRDAGANEPGTDDAGADAADAAGR